MYRNIIVLLCCILMASCMSSKKVVYMQDAVNQASVRVDAYQGIVIQPKDIISIVVSHKNFELAVAFNLPLQSYLAGSSSAIDYNQRLLGYLVDAEGYIDFPILGRLRVAGLNREQMSRMLKQRLIDDGQLMDPIVNVEFMNFRISVIGEVRAPGVLNLQNDKITILEALARAGDLTIHGRRDNVLVQRQEQNGAINFYHVDLRSVALIHSPVFYLRQNDVVYVSPNNTVAARSRINENRTLGVGASIASLLVNIAILVLR